MIGHDFRIFKFYNRLMTYSTIGPWVAFVSHLLRQMYQAGVAHIMYMD